MVGDGQRIPPQSTEAEQAVLGALLIDRDAIIRIAPRLEPGMFASARHRVLYAAMLRLYQDRVPCDTVLLVDLLERTGQLDAAGGAAYLTSLVHGPDTAVHVEYYASLVREAAIRRRAIDGLGRVGGMLYDAAVPLPEIATEANRVFSETFSAYGDDAYITLAEAVALLDDDLNQADRASRLVRSGYPELDQITGGFEPGQEVIIGARPSVGKSAIGIQIAYQHCVREGRPAAYVSLEMSPQAITERLIAIAGRVNMYAYRRQRQPSFELARRVSEAQGIVSNGKLHIVRRTDGRLSTVVAQARDLHARHGIECLIVDYLQLMQGSRGRDNRTQEVSEISRGLKLLALELEIPVIALAQLNRAVELRGADAVPRLSDLRESGSIEADADIVIFPHRQATEPITGEYQEAQFIVAKHRDGPTGSFAMLWRPDTAQYVSVETRRAA